MTASDNAVATMIVPWLLVSIALYSIFGFTETAMLAGSVHAVVVQISTDAGASSASVLSAASQRPSFT